MTHTMELTIRSQIRNSNKTLTSKVKFSCVHATKIDWANAKIKYEHQVSQTDVQISYQTCPVWRLVCHRSFSPGWNHRQACRCSMVSSDHSGTPCTPLGHRDTGSRRHQTRRHGWPLLDLLPSSPLWTEKQINDKMPARVSRKIESRNTHLVESRKTHVAVFSGSLNWLISRSLSVADVLPSSPVDRHSSSLNTEAPEHTLTGSNITQKL